jgi:hypothetical protein
MANNAFDRTIINARERAIGSDINVAQSQLDRSLRETVMQMFAGRLSAASDLTAPTVSGFIGDAFKVRPSAVPGLSVVVTAGLGFQHLPGNIAAIGGVPGLDDLSPFRPLPLLANASLLAIPAGPPNGQDRIDLIEVRATRTTANPLSRDTLDTVTGLFAAGLVNKTLSFGLDGHTGQVSAPFSSTEAVSYKVGIPAPSGHAEPPSVTTGYVKIATVFSQNGNMTGSIEKKHIIDERFQLAGPYRELSARVAASVPSGAVASPSITGAVAPPGMEVFVTKVAAPAQNRVRVTLIGGLGSSAPPLTATGNVIGSGSGFNVLQLTAVTSGVLDATDVATLANSAITANAQQLAQGSKYVAAEFTAINQNGAVTSSAVPDPLTFTAELSLSPI